LKRRRGADTFTDSGSRELGKERGRNKGKGLDRARGAQARVIQQLGHSGGLEKHYNSYSSRDP